MGASTDDSNPPDFGKALESPKGGRKGKGLDQEKVKNRKSTNPFVEFEEDANRSHENIHDNDSESSDEDDDE
jgi:hypothetical protein